MANTNDKQEENYGTAGEIKLKIQETLRRLGSIGDERNRFKIGGQYISFVFIICLTALLDQKINDYFCF